MNLSERTVEILKNFSTINNSLVVYKGNVIRSKTSVKQGHIIFASAVVEEEFPQDFAIYDLTNFLRIISIFPEVEIEFFGNYIEISNGNQTVTYNLAALEVIEVIPPNQDLNFPGADLEFDLSSGDLKQLQKAVNILQLPMVSIFGNGDKLYLQACKANTPSSNEYRLEVGETDARCNMLIKKLNIDKLLPLVYHVSVSSAGVVEFRSDVVTYWMATETGSKWK